jgi:hypothetical protein
MIREPSPGSSQVLRGSSQVLHRFFAGSSGFFDPGFFVTASSASKEISSIGDHALERFSVL